MIAGEAEERTLGVENRLRTRIEDLLANVVGAGRARVQVSAELDLERSTKTAETFDPDGQVVRSTQTRELANSSTDGAGSRGRDGRQRAARRAPTQGDGGGTDREQGSTTEETTNYEISKTTRDRRSPKPAASSASRSRWWSMAPTRPTRTGDSTYPPRTRRGTRRRSARWSSSAVGFTTTRGDQVEVVNMQFAERPELADRRHRRVRASSTSPATT